MQASKILFALLMVLAVTFGLVSCAADEIIALAPDADAILTDVMDLVEEHGLKVEDVRAVIEKDMLGASA